MEIKAYSVTLEVELVEEAKKQMDYSGGKLSPILNALLRDWIEKQKKDKEILEKYGDEKKE